MRKLQNATKRLITNITAMLHQLHWLISGVQGHMPGPPFVVTRYLQQ